MMINIDQKFSNVLHQIPPQKIMFSKNKVEVLIQNNILDIMVSQCNMHRCLSTVKKHDSIKMYFTEKKKKSSLKM